MKLRSGRVITVPAKKRPTLPKKSAKKVRAIVRREINRDKEKKVYYESGIFSLDPPTTVGQIKIGAGITVGDEQFNRDGLSIKLTGLTIRSIINSNEGTQEGWVRYILVKRKEGTGDNSEIDKLFKATDNATGVGRDKNAIASNIKDPINTNLYTVKFDRTIRILRKQADSMGRNFHVKKYYVPLKGTMTWKNNTDANYRSPDYRLLALLWWDDSNATRALASHEVKTWLHFQDR